MTTIIISKLHISNLVQNRTPNYDEMNPPHSTPPTTSASLRSWQWPSIMVIFRHDTACRNHAVRPACVTTFGLDAPSRTFLQDLYRLPLNQHFEHFDGFHRTRCVKCDVMSKQRLQRLQLLSCRELTFCHFADMWQISSRNPPRSSVRPSSKSDLPNWVHVSLLLDGKHQTPINN